MLANFHFLRPMCLIAIIPAIILWILYSRKTHKSENIWSEHCDPHLLSHLLINDAGNSKNTYLASLIMTIWTLMVLALAGPTWSMYANEVYQKNSARVIALNVSQSMNNDDISPTRLDRAKYKILDLLKDYKEGQTGMIAFSSEAFVVSPLTSDSKTIANLVPVINSSIMPVQGVDISKALQKSAELIKNAGYSQGEIILISDGAPTSTDEATATELAKNGYTTTVLAMANDSTDKSYEKLAQKGDGKLIAFTKDNSDVEQLIANTSHDSSQKMNNKLNNATMWRDEGHWLIWIALVLAIFVSRKGWLNKLC
ncbi:MAG: VWA domain-containing protein [Neisseriaceae bacterium]|nr:MAG: VWA domain-containing protein [Neisseriaceae bacterium]